MPDGTPAAGVPSPSSDAIRSPAWAGRRHAIVDTNVLLYAVSTARDEAAKARAAQEFYVQATRTGRKDRLSHEQAALLVESWLGFPALSAARCSSRRASPTGATKTA